MSHGNLQIGEEIPIVYNSFEGNEGLFLRATLRDGTDTVIDTVSVPHIGGGIYRNDTKTMPATTLLNVQVEFFKDAGFTELDENYQKLLFVYKQAQTIPTEGTLAIVERIETKVKQNNRLTTEIKTPRLETKVKTVKTEYRLSQPKIIAILKQPKIIATVREC